MHGAEGSPSLPLPHGWSCKPCCKCDCGAWLYLSLPVPSSGICFISWLLSEWCSKASTSQSISMHGMTRYGLYRKGCSVHCTPGHRPRRKRRSVHGALDTHPIGGKAPCMVLLSTDPMGENVLCQMPLWEQSIVEVVPRGSGRPRDTLPIAWTGHLQTSPACPSLKWH